MRNKHNLRHGLYSQIQQTIDILNVRIKSEDSKLAAEMLNKYLNGTIGKTLKQELEEKK